MNLSNTSICKIENSFRYGSIKLAIMTPMANEADNVERFVTEVLKICRSFGFSSIQFFSIVDKASKDGTVDILYKLSVKTPELKVIYSSKNWNVVDAYVCGYRESIKSKSDWILELDAGFSHRPSDIPKFFYKMQGGFDCVFGSRYFRGKRTSKAPLFRHFMSKGGTILCNALLNTKLSDMTSGFELFKRSTLQQILKIGINSIGPFFQTEIKTHAHKFKIAEVPIYYSAPDYNFRMIELYDALKNLIKLYRYRIN